MYMSNRFNFLAPHRYFFDSETSRDDTRDTCSSFSPAIITAKKAPVRTTEPSDGENGRRCAAYDSLPMLCHHLNEQRRASLTSIKHLLDVSPHDILNIGKLLLQPSGVGVACGVSVILPYSLHRPVKFQESVWFVGPRDDVLPPWIPVLLPQLIHECLVQIRQIPECKTFRVALVRHHNVNDVIF